MTGNENIRIGKVLKEFNIGMGTLVEFLHKKGIDIDSNPGAKLSGDQYALVAKEFKKEQIVKAISIPSLFRPVKYGYRTLVDGGIVNTMPLDKVVRHDGDIVVAFDVNDVDVDSIRQTLISEARMEEERQEEERELEEETRSVINAVRNNSSLTFGEKLRTIILFSESYPCL